ncbi:MAG TPA: hypothetical protein V6C84_16865 [Coleofasciculaceae cyanobacterium]
MKVLIVSTYRAVPPRLGRSPAQWLPLGKDAPPFTTARSLNLFLENKRVCLLPTLSTHSPLHL